MLKNCFFYLVFCFFGSVNCYAQAVTATAQSVTGVRITSVGAVANVRYTVAAANDARSVVTAAVDIGKRSLGAAIRARAFSPAGIALAAAISAAGYLLDSSTGHISGPVTNDYDNEFAASYFTQGVSNNVPCRTAEEACWASQVVTAMEAACNASFANRCVGPGKLVFVSGSNYRVEFVLSVNGNILRMQPVIRRLGSPGGEQPTEYGPLTDEQLWSAIGPTLSESELRDLVTDPVTGRPTGLDQGELEQTGAELAAQKEAGGELAGEQSVDDALLSKLQDIEDAIRGADAERGEDAGEFVAGIPVYDPSVSVPDKENLDGAISGLRSGFAGLESRVGISTSGEQCQFALGVDGADLDFCAWGSRLESVGSLVVAISYLLAGFIVMGVRAE